MPETKSPAQIEIDKKMEELKKAQETLIQKETQGTKPVGEENPPDGLLYNAKGDPTGVDETYWVEHFANTNDVIYDPTEDGYYLFADGIWVRSTRAEVNFWIGQGIKSHCPHCPKKFQTRRQQAEITASLAGMPGVVKRDAFALTPHGILLLDNGRYEIKQGVCGKAVTTWDPECRGLRSDLKRTRMPINYEVGAQSDKLNTWLSRIFQNRVGDVNAVENMMGAALWGSNRWKKLVYISGASNLGKSQIPEIIVRLVGEDNCGELETRRLGEKFEFSKFVGRVFLASADVAPDFMSRSYADALKQLTGFDRLRVERKNANEANSLRGDKMICATSNYKPRVQSVLDASAWEERLVYLEADGTPYERTEQDSYFVDGLFDDPEQASGVLNFAISGLKRLLEHGWEKSTDQIDRVREIMDLSTHLVLWVQECMEVTDKGLEDPDRPGITSGEALLNYQDWCEEKTIEPWDGNKFKEYAKEAVLEVHNKSTCHNLRRGGSSARGWRGLNLCCPK